MPPNGIFFSARPPIQKSMALTPVVAAGPFSQAIRAARSLVVSPATPKTRSQAASCLAAEVAPAVMLAWVP